jgi:hypothetical protein
MRHVYPLLGNDRDISNYTTAVTMQRSVNNSRRTVISLRSVPRCYKQGKLIGESMTEIEDCCSSVVVSCCCEKVVVEAGDSSETQRNGNVHLWKPLPNNGQWRVQKTENTSLCVTVILQSVVTSCVLKCSINPINNPNPVYSHFTT